MKTKLTLALVAIFTGTAFGSMPAAMPEFKNAKQLAEWRAEVTAQSVKETNSTQEHSFYTGKPYVESSGGYAFKYRSYNPELARWTSEDPSGFPDGANCFSYVNNRVAVSIDFLGLTRKSVLWVTLNDLFGNGYLAPSGLNYMGDFNENYTELRTEMTSLDSQSAGTSYPTNYLCDGDLFDKRVVTSNGDLISTANGYSKVFFITHGEVAGGNYSFMAPDGLYYPMSYFDSLWASTSVTMMTCYDGFAPPVNQGSGATVRVDWSDMIEDAKWQTRNYLYE